MVFGAILLDGEGEVGGGLWDGVRKEVLQKRRGGEVMNN